MPIQLGLPTPVVLAALGWLAFRLLQGALRRAQGHTPAEASIEIGPMIGPFIKAVFAGAVAALAWQLMIPSSPVSFAGGNLASEIVTRLAVLMTLPALLIFIAPVAFGVGLIMRGLRVRRGFADVLTGIIAGAVGPLSDVLAGRKGFWQAIEGMAGSGEPLHGMLFFATFPLGGAVAGFTCWAAQGYPGVTKASAKRIKSAQDGVDLAETLASGSAIGMGVQSVKSVRKFKQMKRKRQ